MEIETREELFNALREAAELEQGLLCQYLFAAASLKQTADEGITWPQVELARDWKRTMLEVARQEMAHLGTVCNLITAVGGSPHFGRPNFPQPGHHFPEDAPFSLEPFGESALRRFVRFEEPTPDLSDTRLVEPAPTPIEFQHVGQLYRTIEAGFARLDDGSLFIGPPSAQDDNNWSRGLRLWPVRDLASVRAAINFIVVEGEGTTAAAPNSHHQRFLDAQRALAAERKVDPSFAPARPVATNPMTRPHADAPDGGNLITDPLTKAIAELSSVTYETTLLMLMQIYSFGPETEQQRFVLRQSIREMMSTVVRPLSEMLTLLPMGADQPGLTAGAGYEIYGGTDVSPHVENSWFVFIERLAHEAADGMALASASGAPDRLRLCAENLHRIGANLRRASDQGFRRSSSPTDRAIVAEADDHAEGLIHPPTRTATARYGMAASLEEAESWDQ